MAVDADAVVADFAEMHRVLETACTGINAVYPLSGVSKDSLAKVLELKGSVMRTLRQCLASVSDEMAVQRRLRVDLELADLKGRLAANADTLAANADKLAANADKLASNANTLRMKEAENSALWVSYKELTDREAKLATAMRRQLAGSNPDKAEAELAAMLAQSRAKGSPTLTPTTRSAFAKTPVKTPTDAAADDALQSTPVLDELDDDAPPLRSKRALSLGGDGDDKDKSPKVPRPDAPAVDCDDDASID